MNLSPIQKAEEVLKKSKMSDKFTTHDLVYEAFPDIKELNGSKIGNFKTIIEKLFDNEEYTNYCIALNKCIYTVTDPNSKMEAEDYEKCRIKHNRILNEIYDKII